MSKFGMTPNDNPQPDSNPIEDYRVKGVEEFPLFITENDLSIPDGHMHMWHWHNEVQLCYVTSGEVSFLFEDRTYHLHTGQGIFINAKYVHRAQSDSNPRGTYICIDFQPRLLYFQFCPLLNEYCNQFYARKDIVSILLEPSVEWQKAVLKDIVQVYRLQQANGSYCEMRITAILIEIVAILLAHFDDVQETVPLQTNLPIRMILSYIEAHYTDHITIRDLAQIVHLSESVCCRMFKSTLKCTIFDYIIDCRLRYSASLLAQTEKSVSEIAFQSGFSGTSYFIKQFHKKFECTPKQYRLRHRQDTL